MKREEVLNAAKTCVCGDRDELVRCERCASWERFDHGKGFCHDREGLFRITGPVEHCCCGKEKEDG